MTCIIGCVEGGVVWMAGDSAAPNGWTSRLTRLEKVFQRGPYLIGYTSSFRMGQIIQYHLDVPEQAADDNLEHMVIAFIPALREALKAHGFSKVENNQEAGGQFLVGYRGELFYIGSDFQVNQSHNDFNVCGGGEPYALAVMAALEDSGLSAKKRLQRAIEVTARFNNGVDLPAVVKHAAPPTAGHNKARPKEQVA